MKDIIKEAYENAITAIANESKDERGQKFELDVVDAVNAWLDTVPKFANYYAALRASNTDYSDVAILPKGSSNFHDALTFIECKVDHNAQFCSSRFYYSGGKWHANNPNEEDFADMFSSIPESKKFISNLYAYLKSIGYFNLPANSNGLILKTWKEIFGEEGEQRKISVKLKGHIIPPTGFVMAKELKEFTDQNPSMQYVAKQNLSSREIGEKISYHYLYAKEMPAYYIQSGDNLYLISDKPGDNPLGLKLPLFKDKCGEGKFHLRISFRPHDSEIPDRYECQPEAKIKSLGKSDSSFFRPESIKFIKEDSKKAGKK